MWCIEVRINLISYRRMRDDNGSQKKQSVQVSTNLKASYIFSRPLFFKYIEKRDEISIRIMFFHTIFLAGILLMQQLVESVIMHVR
jgi:hypothetical protein